MRAGLDRIVKKASQNKEREPCEIFLPAGNPAGSFCIKLSIQRRNRQCPILEKRLYKLHKKVIYKYKNATKIPEKIEK